MGNTKLRTTVAKKYTVRCLGPNPRLHTFRSSVNDGSERICAACRNLQDRMRTPPLLLRAVRTDPRND